MTAKEILELFEEEDPRLETVSAGDWVSEHKYELCTTIVEDTETGKLWAIHQSRSGSYFSDYFYDDPTATEVVAYQVTRTEYRAVK
jgi:hypothetical protein